MNIQKSEWGKHDCISAVFGVSIQRPQWVANAKNERECMAAARARYGSVAGAWEHFLREFGKHDYIGNKMRDILPGDVIVGDTNARTHGDVAVVSDNYLPYRRTLQGLEPVGFTYIESIWRPKCRS